MPRTVQQDESVTLFIEVRDIYGVLVDSDVSPLVSIFDFDSDPRHPSTDDTEAIVLDASLTVLGTGLQVGTNLVQRVAQGIYSYEYDVADDAHVGTWFDRWVVVIDGVESEAILQWSVTPGTTITDPESVNTGTDVLYPNNVVIVTVYPGIEATDGSVLTEQFQYYFTTVYNPLYASIRQIRIRAGAYLSSVPDDTINLAIFEAGLAANSLVFGMQYPVGNGGIPVGWEMGTGEINYGFGTSGNITNARYFNHIRQQYVICKAICSLLGNSLGSTAKKKRLADFSVEYGDSGIGGFMDKLCKECHELEMILNSGGALSRGSSVPMNVAQKSVYWFDQPDIGRRFTAPQHQNGIPAYNTKQQCHPRSNYKHIFRKDWRR